MVDARCREGERGAVALISVLVLMAASLAIVTGMNLLAISESSTASLHARSTGTFYQTDACVEEALYRLSKDSAYGGGSIQVGSIVCRMDIQDQGSCGVGCLQRGITACASTDPVAPTSCLTAQGQLVRRIEAVARITTTIVSTRPIQSLALTSWKEVTQ